MSPSQQMVWKSAGFWPTVSLAHSYGPLPKSDKSAKHQFFIIPEGTAVVIEEAIYGDVIRSTRAKKKERKKKTKIKEKEKQE